MQVGAMATRMASAAVGTVATGGDGDFASALAKAGETGGGTAAVAPPSADVPTADGVSAAQGLPAGTYDFTRISPRQFAVVVPALVGSGRIGAHALDAASDLVGGDAGADTPINMFAYLKHEAEANEAAAGGMQTAFGQRTALSVLTRLQREDGVPITYDDLYPTAPRAMTAEEATAKLKSAIADFRKESAMTPAQRLAKRLRGEVMREMKVSDDDLKAMAPEARDALETKIDAEVARRMVLLGFAGADGKAADGKAGDGQASDGQAGGDAAPAVAAPVTAAA